VFFVLAYDNLHVIQYHDMHDVASKGTILCRDHYYYVSDVSDDPDGIFVCCVQRRSQRPLLTKQLEFALS
jgi:hypothetical protein